MKLLFTGMNGTVAPVVARYFHANGHQIISYDRNIISTTDFKEITSFMIDQHIEGCLHFAMGSVEWSEMLARIANEHSIKFLYVSTVSVFSNTQIGPHDITRVPQPDDDYGRYKYQSELAIKNVNPHAYIARIGWQIGSNDEGNQMIHYFKSQMQENGYIAASSLWYPSCSFLEDTAKALYAIFSNLSPDLYLVNSNDHYTFYKICNHFAKLYDWMNVRETKHFTADHRMIDDRVKIKKFSEYFT